MRRRRSRSLTAEEARLWAEVARSVVPLGGREAPPPDEPPPSGPTPPAADPPRPAPSPSRPLPSPPPRLALPPLAPLEPRTVRALSRGRTRPDAVLDLHGLTQAEAHRRLVAFLRAAQSSGHALVLVITGQGGVGSLSGGQRDLLGGERGVLRRVVPQWLGLPELRPIVLGFETAGPRQGGAGALHVRLRRPQRL